MITGWSVVLDIKKKEPKKKIPKAYSFYTISPSDCLRKFTHSSFAPDG